MKYRRKTTIVDAEQFIPGMSPLPAGVEKDESGYYAVTLDGERHVGPGWWVIHGPGGYLTVLRPDVFAATYEPIEEAP